MRIAAARSALHLRFVQIERILWIDRRDAVTDDVVGDFGTDTGRGFHNFLITPWREPPGPAPLTVSGNGHVSLSAKCHWT